MSAASQEAAAPSEEPVAWQETPPDIVQAARVAADTVGVTPYSVMRVHVEHAVRYALLVERASPAVAPVAVSVKPFVPSERLEQLIGTQAASEAETHDMAVELILHRRGALSSIIPDPFGLSGEQIETLRSNGLKPEEIAGDQRTQARRVSELLHWFVRLARDSANPKWTRSHAFELAYYLATTDDRAPFDISAVERAAWLRGLQEPAAVRDMAVRHGWIPALSSIIPATKGGEDELHAISAAIGSVRFMDPPDGGDVSLAEQVSRMRQALKIAEAGVQAARPIIEALIAQEYNVETWGLRSLLAALSAQDTDGVAK